MVFIGSILAGLIAFVCGEPGVSLPYSMRSASNYLLGPIPCWLPYDESGCVWHVWLVLCSDDKMFRQLHLVRHFGPGSSPID
jgi:hypothetical protein